MLSIQAHPLLDAAVFTSIFPEPLGVLSTPLLALDVLAGKGVVPALGGFPEEPILERLHRLEMINQAARALLRAGGFKPSGRSKPASEYLQRECGSLQSINLAVDLCNLVSLASGLPISVVDLTKAQAPFSISVVSEGSYLFNASGQSIDLKTLLCLWDSQGPCANAVKDSQRTKTSSQTQSTLTVIWGSTALPGYSSQVFQWYSTLLQQAGAQVQRIS